MFLSTDNLNRALSLLHCHPHPDLCCYLEEGFTAFVCLFIFVGSLRDPLHPRQENPLLYRMKSGGGSMKELTLVEITFRGTSVMFALIFYGYIFKRTFPSLSHSSPMKRSQARKCGSLASAYLRVSR